jgi:hypothetical protein
VRRFEILHNFQKLVIDAGPISKFHLDLIEVQQRIFHLEFFLGGRRRRTSCGWPCTRGSTTRGWSANGSTAHAAAAARSTRTRRTTATATPTWTLLRPTRSTTTGTHLHGETGSHVGQQRMLWLGRTPLLVGRRCRIRVRINIATTRTHAIHSLSLLLLLLLLHAIVELGRRARLGLHRCRSRTPRGWLLLLLLLWWTTTAKHGPAGRIIGGHSWLLLLLLALLGPHAAAAGTSGKGTR